MRCSATVRFYSIRSYRRCVRWDLTLHLVICTVQIRQTGAGARFDGRISADYCRFRHAHVVQHRRTSSAKDFHEEFATYRLSDRGRRLFLTRLKGASTTSAILFLRRHTAAVLAASSPFAKLSWEKLRPIRHSECAKAGEVGRVSYFILHTSYYITSYFILHTSFHTSLSPRWRALPGLLTIFQGFCSRKMADERPVHWKTNFKGWTGRCFSVDSNTVGFGVISGWAG